MTVLIEIRTNCPGVFYEATTLDANLIAGEGKAAPAIVPTPARTPAASVFHGAKHSIALTVCLAPSATGG